MKHLLLIALCLLLVLPVCGQEKPDLSILPAELETYAQIAQNAGWLDAKRASANAALIEADKLILKCNWRTKKQCEQAVKLRKTALELAQMVDKEATQLNKDFEALQKTVRDRVGGDATWQIDWRNRRIVKPVPPKGN